MNLTTTLKGHGKKPRERQFRERSPLLRQLSVYVQLFWYVGDVYFTHLNYFSFLFFSFKNFFLY